MQNLANKILEIIEKSPQSEWGEGRRNGLYIALSHINGNAAVVTRLIEAAERFLQEATDGNSLPFDELAEAIDAAKGL